VPQSVRHFSELIVHQFGYSVGFLSLARESLLAFLILAVFMPETKDDLSSQAPMCEAHSDFMNSDVRAVMLRCGRSDRALAFSCGTSVARMILSLGVCTDIDPDKHMGMIVGQTIAGTSQGEC
jgi:hypothetical protein